MSSHHHSSSHHSSVQSISHVSAHTPPATSHVSKLNDQPAVGKTASDPAAKDASTSTKDHTTLSDEAQADQKPTQDGTATQPNTGEPNAPGQAHGNDPNANGQNTNDPNANGQNNNDPNANGQNTNNPNANGQTNGNDPNANGKNPNDPNSQAIQDLTSQLQQLQAEIAALQNQQAQQAGQGNGQQGGGGTQGGGGSDGGGGQQGGGGSPQGAQPAPGANPAGMGGLQPGLGGQDPNTLLMADVMQVEQVSAGGAQGQMQKQAALVKLRTDYQQVKLSGGMVNPQVDQMVQQLLGTAGAGLNMGGFGGFPGGAQMGGIGIPQMGGAFSFGRL